MQQPASIILVCFLLTALVAAQDTGLTTLAPPTRAIELTGPAELHRIQPIAGTISDGNRNRVNVHVPIFFDMFKEHDIGTGSGRLDLSVLGGLVTVNRERAARFPGSIISEPTAVTVFGIPIFTGNVFKYVPPIVV